MRPKTLVPLSTIVVEKRNLLGFYINLSLSVFRNIKHLFPLEVIRKIEGDLRRGDLTACQHPDVLEMLSKARATNNLSIETFAAVYQFSSLTKKLALPGSDDLCKKNGMAKLFEGEASCKNTNETIFERISQNTSLFNSVKRIIENIMGSVPTDLFTKNRVEEPGENQVIFGPGSTVNCDNRDYEKTSLFYKITDRLIVPERAKYYLAALVSSHPHWVEHLGTHYCLQRNSEETNLQYELRVMEKHFEIVPDDFPSRIGFVPKSSDEHRTIGIELNGLVPLQMIVGKHIAAQLYKKTRINLKSQERNRHLARLAQTFGLATIDLKNASSSISLELVRALFPTEWMILFETFRSSHGCVKGEEPLKYEMISSMGNGFTFELESLIFYALAKATCQNMGVSPVEINRSLTVFGDDIILPARCASVFYENLTLFGFTPNVEKSFTKGFFYESCGYDYYNSTDVRPFFLKRAVSTLKDFYFLMNSMMFRAIRQNRSDLVGAYKFCFKHIVNKCSYGPLHFEVNSYGKIQTDDLEAILRVPLSYAQEHGGVKFNYKMYAWQYKKWVNISLLDPLGESPQPTVRYARYMTFLRGELGGKVKRRGRVRSRQTSDVTSRWDGHLTIDSLRMAALMLP